MDADLQHEPESVPDVAQPVLEGQGAHGQRMHRDGQGMHMPCRCADLLAAGDEDE